MPSHITATPEAEKSIHTFLEGEIEYGEREMARFAEQLATENAYMSLAWSDNHCQIAANLMVHRWALGEIEADETLDFVAQQLLQRIVSDAACPTNSTSPMQVTMFRYKLTAKAKLYQLIVNNATS